MSLYEEPSPVRQVSDETMSNAMVMTNSLTLRICACIELMSTPYVAWRTSEARAPRRCIELTEEHTKGERSGENLQSHLCTMDVGSALNDMETII
jgi:hypothetical protein